MHGGQECPPYRLFASPPNTDNRAPKTHHPSPVPRLPSPARLQDTLMFQSPMMAEARRGTVHRAPPAPRGLCLRQFDRRNILVPPARHLPPASGRRALARQCTSVIRTVIRSVRRSGLMLCGPRPQEGAFSLQPTASPRSPAAPSPTTASASPAAFSDCCSEPPT